MLSLADTCLNHTPHLRNPQKIFPPPPSLASFFSSSSSSVWLAGRSQKKRFNNALHLACLVPGACSNISQTDFQKKSLFVITLQSHPTPHRCRNIKIKPRWGGSWRAVSVCALRSGPRRTQSDYYNFVSLIAAHDIRCVSHPPATRFPVSLRCTAQ